MSFYNNPIYVGFDTESIEYIDKKLDALHKDLPRYIEEVNKKFIHLTKWKIEFYESKRNRLLAYAKGTTDNR